jgi:hypothetical protein
MFMVGYYRGLPLNLRTPLPPDEAARRIGAAARCSCSNIAGRSAPGWTGS